MPLGDTHSERHGSVLDAGSEHDTSNCFVRAVLMLQFNFVDTVVVIAATLVTGICVDGCEIIEPTADAGTNEFAGAKGTAGI